MQIGSLIKKKKKEKKNTVQELKEYEQIKNYTTYIVDTAIAVLATVSKTGVVGYFLHKEMMKDFIFKPLNSESKTIIELAFINGHYDLIVDKLVLPVTTDKKLFDTNVNITSIKIIDLVSEPVESNTQFSLNASQNVSFNIKPSLIRDVDTEMANLSFRKVDYASISLYDTDDEEITGDVTYMGKIKSVHDYIHDVVQPVSCDFVPDNINSNILYIVPLQLSRKMNNFKETRP